MNLLKMRKSGVLSRHRHPQAVHGLVLKGRWHYLEHDWVAEEGSYVFEPPGETHTLVVPDDVDESHADSRTFSRRSFCVGSTT
jgi:quercetin dioxygenase-like cupin family protein